MTAVAGRVGAGQLPGSALAVVFVRGPTRQRDLLLTLLTGLAMATLAGWLGGVLGAVALLCRAVYQPPPSGLWLITAQDMQRPLWLDAQRVILRKPYRVIYRDEVQPELFCRLRRRARGLPC